MDRDSQSLRNLADELSEDILAAPAEALAAEAAEERGDPNALASAFDRIAARATRQARWRRLVARARALASPLAPRPSWRHAMAVVAGLAVIVVAGDLYWHMRPDYVQTAAPQIAATEAPAKRSLDDVNLKTQMSFNDQDAGDRLAAAPPAATAPVAAEAARGAASDRKDEAKRVPTIAIRPEQEGAPAASLVVPPPALAPEQEAASGNRVAAQAARAAMEKTAQRAAPPRSASVAAPQVAAVEGGAAEDRDAQATKDRALYFGWPLRGRVLAPFGANVGGALNSGIDIAAPIGTDIRAAEDGVVTFAGSLEGFGNVVQLRHRDGFVTAYAHASQILVKLNDRVRRGQVIAKSGRAGTAGEPQLHFEIRKGDAPLDPARYLPAG